MTTKRTKTPAGGDDVKRTHGTQKYADGGKVKTAGDHARAAQRMRQEKTLRTVARKQQADKFARMKDQSAPKALKADAWPKDRPRPVAKSAAAAKPAAKMSAGKAARALAGRAGPVAAAGAAGAAIGSKIYEKNATRIQDGLEKLTRGKK